MPARPPGTLYVVSTPIGNLEDISLRALRILREVDLIAAEDTRRTARLLQHYAISTPTTSLHAHNERRQLPRLTARLREGASVALVSDAGTPTISDPGVTFVRAARNLGIKVEAIPGPSALTAALAASGVPADRFQFEGFAPRRSKARTEWLHRIARAEVPVVFFEAPHRVRQTLLEAAKILGDRPIIIARELTKTFEELVELPISAAISRLEEPKGEYTIILPVPISVLPPSQVGVNAEHLAHEYGQMTKTGLSRRSAIRQLARQHSLRARQVYDMLEQVKLISVE